MKRTLVLIRHAKAGDMGAEQKDFDRPLTERGKLDSVEMGKILSMAGLKPDRIISSPAKRTRQTAKRIAEAVGFSEEKITWIEKMYHCTAATLETEISALPDSVCTVFMVGHNPGITEFAWQLDPGFKIENMPTCAIVAAHVELSTWAHFASGDKKVFLYKHP